jgi:peptide/nickel transport system permease protein
MTTAPAALPASEAAPAGRWAPALRKLLKHRLAVLGLFICLAVTVLALFADFIAPYDPSESHYDAIKVPPQAGYWLGTDELGRDVLSRIIFGARVSLQVTFISIAGAVVFGSALGMIAGYVRGWVDHVIMRVMDAMMAFPMLVLALGIIAVLGPDLMNAIIALTIINVPSFARIVRAQVLYVGELDYVLAARALGASDTKIMARYIWPGVVGNLIVYASLRASSALITESSLAFLGLGAQPPAPSWGQMLSTAMQYWDAWWMSIFPGMAIFLSVLALNFVGDGLRDALDARLSD